ncbi:hypothetical protein PHPALM_7938, partial [Phytophthora palmivora]
DWKAIAEHYNVDERTTWGWIDTARNSDDLSGDQKKRGGSKKKILPTHIEYLLDEFASKPELALVQMAERVEQKFPAILRVPDGTTTIKHRAQYLRRAADPLFVEIVTPYLCNRVFCHSLPHHRRHIEFYSQSLDFIKIYITTGIFIFIAHF